MIGSVVSTQCDRPTDRWAEML